MHTRTSHGGRLACLLCLALLAALGTAVRAQTLTINGAGTYGGNWGNIVVKTTAAVTIDGATVRGPGDLITAGVGGVNVTIRNTRGYGTPPTSSPGSNVAQGRFIFFYGAKSVTVEHNYTEHTAGIKVWDDGRTTSYVRIRYNQAFDVDNRWGNTSGSGYQNDGELGNWIQFNQLKGVDAEIAWNQEINKPGESYVEDSISTYASSGTSANPINLHDNYVQGGYLADPHGTKSNGSTPFTGTGINLGDAAAFTNGSGTPIVAQYVNCHDNQIVSYGDHGISLTSGNAQDVHDNRVVSSGYLPDGSTIGYLAEGIVGQNFWGDSQWNVGTPNKIFNNVVGNYSAWFHQRLDYSDFAGQGVWNWGNTSLPDPITLAAEANEYTLWQNKLSANGIYVGLGNLLPNADFEQDGVTQTPSHWIEVGNLDASYTESYGGAQSGAYHLTHYSASPYTAYTYQTISVPNGDYTFSAWVRTNVVPGSGRNVALVAKNFGGSDQYIDIPSQANPNTWTLVTTPVFTVTNGSVEVGFWSGNMAGSDFVYMDNCALVDPPKPPTGLTATAGAAGSRKITLTWSAGKNLTGYKVYRSTGLNGAYSAIASPTAVSYTNTGLAAGTTYYYKVTALQDAHQSALSGAVSAKAQ